MGWFAVLVGCCVCGAYASVSVLLKTLKSVMENEEGVEQTKVTTNSACKSELLPAYNKKKKKKGDAT
jgi:hypothetical protein